MSEVQLRAPFFALFGGGAFLFPRLVSKALALSLGVGAGLPLGKAGLGENGE